MNLIFLLKMKKAHPLFMLFLALALESRPYTSYSTPLSTPLTWEECVRQATEENPSLRAARQSSSASEDTTLSTRSGFLPQLSGALGYNYANSTSVSGGGVLLGGNSNGGYGNYSVTLSASENLFNGLSDLAKYRQAQANEGIARVGLLKAKAQVSYNLKVAFEGLQYALRSEKLAREIIARREQNLRLVELQFKVGRENKGSVLLYRAYLKDANYAELQSRNRILTSKAQLAAALGLQDAASLEVSGEIPTHSPWGSDLKTLIPETPEYLQAYYQEEFANEGVTLARSGFFPTLGLSGSLSHTGADWFPQNERWSVGLNLSIPLFNGGRDFYGTRSAIESRAAADSTLHEVSHQVLAELETAHTSFVEAISKLEVDESYLEAARVRAQIARADYKNGIMSFQDWDLVETDLISRERSLLQSQQARVVAEAAFEQVQGKGVIP